MCSGPSPNYSRSATIALAVLLSICTVTPVSGAACEQPVIRTGDVPITAAPASTGLRVVSLNMAREIRLDAILRDLKQLEADAVADVWLLQEAAEGSSTTIAA